MYNDALISHTEWVEGIGDRWNFWVFVELADIDVEDILIDDTQNLAVTVERIALFTTFQGEFHHYEIVGPEHPLSVAELDAQVA